MNEQHAAQFELMREHFGLDESGNPPELHPDLKPYISKRDAWVVLSHPLVVDVGYAPIKAGYVNRMYEAKLKAIDEAKRQKQWPRFVWLHERPYRLDAFIEIAPRLSNKDYWGILSDIWTDSENIWQNREAWETLLNDERPQRKYLMSPQDRAKLQSLPEEFTIYRGWADSGDSTGLSWTLDRARAEWFARRFARRHAKVSIAQVEKPNVIFYSSDRSEDEIVTDNVKLRRIEELGK